MKTRVRAWKGPGGFTLVELMVVIVIVAVLSSLAFMFTRRAVMKAEKVKVLQQMRDLAQGMEGYIADYNRPPIPGGKAPGSDRDRLPGYDTIYGDPPPRNYGNAAIIASLMGESDRQFSQDNGEIFEASQLNPKGNQYINFPLSPDKKYGVGKDGALYDPWGREVIIAINAHPPGSPIHERVLQTYGLGEWLDKVPRYEQYAFWSYGRDGVKAETYQGSDDVAHW